MFIISMKQKSDKNQWTYLVQNFDNSVYFILSEESAKKFYSIRDAQGFFKRYKKVILRNVNLSKYDISTLAIRRVTYIEDCKLQFNEKDFKFASKEDIEIGDVVTHDDFYRGTVIDITNDYASVEFSFGPNSGGTLLYKISELKKFNTV